MVCALVPPIGFLLSATDSTSAQLEMPTARRLCRHFGAQLMRNMAEHGNAIASLLTLRGIWPCFVFRTKTNASSDSGFQA